MAVYNTRVRLHTQPSAFLLWFFLKFFLFFSVVRQFRGERVVGTSVSVRSRRDGELLRSWSGHSPLYNNTTYTARRYGIRAGVAILRSRTYSAPCSCSVRRSGRHFTNAVPKHARKFAIYPQVRYSYVFLITHEQPRSFSLTFCSRYKCVPTHVRLRAHGTAVFSYRRPNTKKKTLINAVANDRKRSKKMQIN